MWTIYVVRDPRSVAVSYAYHANVSFEDSVDLILNENRLTYDKSKMYPEARLSWNVNLVSWLNTPYPKLLIKYEQLKLNTFKEFKSILLFLNKFTKFEINDQKIDKVIKDCSFENLTNLEKKIGFKEKFGKVNFFRKGESDEWKRELSVSLIKKIEEKFNSEMKDLGYL